MRIKCITQIHDYYARHSDKYALSCFLEFMSKCTRGGMVQNGVGN